MPPLNSFVSPFIFPLYAGRIYSSASHLSKAFQAFLASSACQPSATSYHSCSAAPRPWLSAFAWVVPVFKSGRPFLAFGSNCSSQPTAYGGG